MKAVVVIACLALVPLAGCKPKHAPADAVTQTPRPQATEVQVSPPPPSEEEVLPDPPVGEEEPMPEEVAAPGTVTPVPPKDE